MNLIAAMLILVCLVGSEMIGATAADDLVRRIAAVLITAALVPALAFFQTSALIYKMQRENFSHEAKQSLCRRMTISHALAWLSASGAIIWALRWQDIVRGNWHLDRWPLVDEALILAPAIVSMMASWAIFYELQASVTDSSPRRSKLNPQPSLKAITSNKTTTSGDFVGRLPWLTRQFSQLRPRVEFVSLRFRVYFLIVLIPVGILVLLRDGAQQLAALPEPVVAAITIGGLFTLMLAFPFLMLLVWHNGPIMKSELRQELLATCRTHRLHVFDVRTWRTGHQIINAAVAGWFPFLRIIFLSDGLLRQFDRDEILAVLRHEAGHIRLWHVPTRMMFLLLPPMIMLIGWGGPLEMNSSKGFEILNSPMWLPLLVAAVYALVVTRWLSHSMEYEADWYSIRADEFVTETKKFNGICPRRAASMKAALLRLAAISPGELDRRTLLHPSLRQRIDFLVHVEAKPMEGRRFQQRFARGRYLLMLGLVVVWLAVQWI